MKKVSKRYIRRLVPVALALAMIGVLAPSSANAATYTNVTVTPTDPTAGNATTWTFSVSNATGGSVGCLEVYMDTSASFATASEVVTPTGTPGGASLFTAGTWTSGPTAIASSSGYKWLSTGGMTSAAGANKTFTLSVTNPAANTYYVNVLTFSDTGCSTPIDSGIGAAVTTTNTQVSVTVDPTFTFAVNGQASSTVCNGITAGVTSTSSTVPFGHLAASGRQYAVQQLSVTTNAGNGYVVDLRSTSASANVLKGQSTHVINDATAGAVPAAGNSFFGYNTDSSTAAMTSGNIKPVPQTAGNDIVGNGVASTGSNNCVGFAVGASATTPADTYTATLVYTAIPTF